MKPCAGGDDPTTDIGRRPTWGGVVVIRLFVSTTDKTLMWGVLLLAERQGDAALLALCTTVAAVVGLLGRWPAARRAERVSRRLMRSTRRCLIATVILSLLGALAVPIGPPTTLLALLVPLWFLRVLNGAHLSRAALLATADGEMVSKTGYYRGLRGLCTSAAPLLAGLLVDAHGIDAVLGGHAVICGMAAALVATLTEFGPVPATRTRAVVRERETTPRALSSLTVTWMLFSATAAATVVLASRACGHVWSLSFEVFSAAFAAGQALSVVVTGSPHFARLPITAAAGCRATALAFLVGAAALGDARLIQAGGAMLAGVALGAGRTLIFGWVKRATDRRRANSACAQVETFGELGYAAGSSGAVGFVDLPVAVAFGGLLSVDLAAAGLLAWRTRNRLAWAQLGCRPHPQAGRDAPAEVPPVSS